MSKKKPKNKSSEESGLFVVAVNKQARRNYELIKKFEAGIQLIGSEVKSIRAGNANLKESYVKEQKGELFLVGCHISAYSHAPVDAYEPTRERKLLLHKDEIISLQSSVQKKGLSIVPLRLYFKNGRCKLEIATGRGKKLHDKRDDIKRKEADRHMERALKIKG